MKKLINLFTFFLCLVIFSSLVLASNHYPALDCQGQDYTGYEGWIGDNYCDDGAYGLYFDCAAFNCDEGDCTCPVCGDGVTEGSEECDDSNTVNGDGCDSTCNFEPVCGDGVTEGSEQCDDSNIFDGDGCSSTCIIESVCGDGVTEGSEQCDDSNTVNGDGCDSSCQFEDNDGDGSPDFTDSDDNDPTVCSDIDSDTCDDCSTGTFDINDDGFDYDSDGLCDAGDPDDDNDLSLDVVDSDVNNELECSDIDGDTCDDCSSGTFNLNNDGFDYDSDGLCDAGDPDDDNDGALDGADSDDNNENLCSDNNSDNCDDCAGGSYDLSFGCPICGDGVTEGNEDCDDANLNDGDGCTAGCSDTGFECGDGNIDSNSQGMASLGAQSGLLGSSEVRSKINLLGANENQIGHYLSESCDDSNTNDNDGCSSVCEHEGYCDDGNYDPCHDNNDCSGGVVCQNALHCGDGVLSNQNYVGNNEECDDGNNLDNDGCSSICHVEYEYGWDCDYSSPSVCTPEVCGNGIVGGNEECDDGNTADTDNNGYPDGCDSTCNVQNGWDCEDEFLGPSGPSVCNNCGDGIIQGYEACDDQNNDETDGCGDCEAYCGWENGPMGWDQSECNSASPYCSWIDYYSNNGMIGPFFNPFGPFCGVSCGTFDMMGMMVDEGYNYDSCQTQAECEAVDNDGNSVSDYRWVEEPWSFNQMGNSVDCSNSGGLWNGADQRCYLKSCMGQCGEGDDLIHCISQQECDVVQFTEDGPTITGGVWAPIPGIPSFFGIDGDIYGCFTPCGYEGDNIFGSGDPYEICSSEVECNSNGGFWGTVPLSGPENYWDESVPGTEKCYDMSYAANCEYRGDEASCHSLDSSGVSSCTWGLDKSQWWSENYYEVGCHNAYCGDDFCNNDELSGNYCNGQGRDCSYDFVKFYPYKLDDDNDGLTNDIFILADTAGPNKENWGIILKYETLGSCDNNALPCFENSCGNGNTCVGYQEVIEFHQPQNVEDKTILISDLPSLIMVTIGSWIGVGTPSLDYNTDYCLIPTDYGSVYNCKSLAIGDGGLTDLTHLGIEEETDCSNGMDDNNDGHTDCDDFSCNGLINKNVDFSSGSWSVIGDSNDNQADRFELTYSSNPGCGYDGFLPVTYCINDGTKPIDNCHDRDIDSVSLFGSQPWNTEWAGINDARIDNDVLYLGEGSIYGPSYLCHQGASLLQPYVFCNNDDSNCNVGSGETCDLAHYSYPTSYLIGTNARTNYPDPAWIVPKITFYDAFNDVSISVNNPNCAPGSEEFCNENNCPSGIYMAGMCHPDMDFNSDGNLDMYESTGFDWIIDDMFDFDNDGDSSDSEELTVQIISQFGDLTNDGQIMNMGVVDFETEYSVEGDSQVENEVTVHLTNINSYPQGSYVQPPSSPYDINNCLLITTDFLDEDGNLMVYIDSVTTANECDHLANAEVVLTFETPSPLTEEQIVKVYSDGSTISVAALEAQTGVEIISSIISTVRQNGNYDNEVIFAGTVGDMFSGYAASGNAVLYISDSYENSSANISNSITFEADYTDSAGNSITNAGCVLMNDELGNFSMGYIAGVYNHTEGSGFSSDGLKTWMVECSKVGYTTLLAVDDILIGDCGNGVLDVGEECDDGNNVDGDGCSSTCMNESTPAVPEFSDYAIALLLLTVVGGFVAMRRKQY